VTASDRSRWDERYARQPPVAIEAIGPPLAFVGVVDQFPTSGSGLDVACGDGRGSAWLAGRGLQVLGLDVSTVAVDRARDLVERAGLSDRCRVEVTDLDDGLPTGRSVDVVLCHLFNAPHLDAALVERVRPGGLLAVAVLSEVGAPPGRFRAVPGELVGRFGAFADLTVLDSAEGDGVARLVARRDHAATLAGRGGTRPSGP
jgi:SAM-dependent methyltransferase